MTLPLLLVVLIVPVFRALPVVDTNIAKEANKNGNSPPVIHVHEVGQSIMCLIEDFSPKKLSIKWKEDNQEVEGIDWEITENPTGSIKAVSLIQANQTSMDTKYTCEVTHAGLTYVQQLSSKAKFSLKINPPSEKNLFVQNKAVITCVITGDSKKEVEAANLSWTVGGQTPNPPTIVTDNVKETTPPFTKTSTLTLSESEWFSGSEVKCSTERDKTPFSEKIRVKIGGERPSVLFYKPEKHVSDSDKVSLLCEVSSSDLGDVYIMWQKNGGEYMEGSSTVHINNNTVLSYLTVSGKEYNDKKNKFICAVKDANKENDTTPRTNSTSASKLPPCPAYPFYD
uniref:Ig-like domain-containing protein n=1 Tax=Astyanax mexicanus TaxID=7994 RepID=W5LFJ5_ASTMX